MAYISTTRRLGVDPWSSQTDAQFQQVLNEGAAGLPAGSPDPFDPLGDLGDLETGIEDLITNALPSSLGGQALTSDELQSIQTQTASDITQAATNPVTGQVDTDLANSEISQMLGETQSVADQANASSGSSVFDQVSSWIQDNWAWVAIGGVAFLIVRPDKILFGRR